MQQDDFYPVGEKDLPRLVLENQFLALEAQTLRAKIHNVDGMIAEKETIIVERNAMVSEKNRTIKERNATIARRDRVIADLQAQLQEAFRQAEGKALIAKDELEDLKQAKRDLRWTLDRLRRTPVVGPLIARRSGFARLAESYLRD